MDKETDHSKTALLTKNKKMNDDYEVLAVSTEPYTSEIMDSKDERHEDIEQSNPWSNHPFKSLIGKPLPSKN